MRLLTGDACEILPTIRESSVDLTVFSPPYDGLRDYKGKPSFDMAVLGREILRVTKEGGVCCMVIQDATKNGAKSLTSFRTACLFADLGWRLFECCIYSRAGVPGAWWTKRFRVDHEYIFIFTRGDGLPRRFDKTSLMVESKYAGITAGGTKRTTKGDFVAIKKTVISPLKCRGTIWHYAASNTERNKTKSEHPATYPDSLARDIISCFSKEGDLVLDPMMGSGTTGIASVNMGRRFLGIEISVQYMEIAKRRFRAECVQACA